MYSDVFRIGNDIELRYTSEGKAVLSLSLAADVGFGNNKRTSWFSAALWEKRAESLAPYLNKGDQVFCVLSDIELDEYKTREGTSGAKIKARVVDLKLIGQREAREERAPQQSPAPQNANTQHGGSDDFEDDIPF